jgi:hypothetical protein
MPTFSMKTVCVAAVPPCMPSTTTTSAPECTASFTSLYVRVQDKDTGIVYATYSLGRTIAFEQPQAEIDRANQLHVLHCAAPRAWSYSRIGLNGELLAHSSFMEAKSRPRLVHSGDGEVAVRGGIVEAPVDKSRSTAPKLSGRPPGLSQEDQ